LSNAIVKSESVTSQGWSTQLILLPLNHLLHSQVTIVQIACGCEAPLWFFASFQ